MPKVNSTEEFQARIAHQVAEHTGSAAAPA
jgi:hypothetical protein